MSVCAQGPGQREKERDLAATSPTHTYTMETMPQNSTSAYDYLLKILIIGDTSSNKRVLLGTYLEDCEHEERSSSTLGD